MKQNKRFWLAAVAVLLIATMMVSGLALAGQTPDPTAFIREITGYEKTKTGMPKTEYLFYGIHRQKDIDPSLKEEYAFNVNWKDEWKGLVDERAKAEPADTLVINVALGKAGLDGIKFNYEGSDDPDAGQEFDESFFFVSSDQTALAVGANAYNATTKEYLAADKTTLTWNGKKTGTFTVTVYAANGVRKFADLDKEHIAKETFTIKIEPMKVALKVVNGRAPLKAKVKNGTFDFEIFEKVDRPERAWDKKSLHLAETFDTPFDYSYQKYPVTEHATGKRIGFVFKNERKAPPVVAPDKTVYPEDVLFDLVYTPTNARDLDKQFAATVDTDVYGFTFAPSGDNVGTFEKLLKYAQRVNIATYPARPWTYMDWNLKDGTAKVEITAVDKNAKKVNYIDSDTATLNFNINKETEIQINTTYKDENGKVVKAPVTVNEEDTIDIYHLEPYKGLYPITTQVLITDENGNGKEPTYANGFADVIWYSDNTDIVRVTKDGRITGIKAGKAIVKAKGHYKTGEIEVEVFPNQSAITKIEFNQNPAVYKITKGQQRPINAYVLTVPHDTVDYFVKSSNPDILEVLDGDTTDPISRWTTLYAKKEGTVTVTVTPKGKPELAITATFTVVDEMESIAFNKDTYSFPLNSWGTLYTVATPLTTEYNLADEYVVIFDDATLISSYSVYSNSIEVYGYKPGKTNVTIVNKYDDTTKATATLVIEPVKAESIKLKKDSIKLYFVDTKKSSDSSDSTKDVSASFTSYVKFTPSKAQVSDTVNVWDFETSDASVAIVSVTGTITPTGVGTATITGTYDDGVNKAELKLTVNVEGDKKVDPEPEPAKSNPIVVEPEDGKYYINVVKGAKNEKQLIVYDAVTGEEVDVKWASKDTKMATVSKTGVVKAKGKGRVVITATTLDGTQKYNIGLTLNQKPVEQINVLYEKVELKVGEKFIVGASVYPKHAYNQELGYKSSNKKVVTVDGGILTAKKPGTATITISAKDGSGVKATVEVTVVK